jgi:hypothetical protein
MVLFKFTVGLFVLFCSIIENLTELFWVALSNLTWRNSYYKDYTEIDMDIEDQNNSLPLFYTHGRPLLLGFLRDDSLSSSSVGLAGN